VKLRKRVLRQLGAVAASCTLVAACTPSGPPVSTPSPTPASTSPSETQLERQTRLAFEAAEKAYRANSAEVQRLSLAGGTYQPTKVLKNTSTGEYLKLQMSALKFLMDHKYRSSGKASIRWVKNESFEQARLKIQACEDSSGIALIDSYGKKVPSDSKGNNFYIQDITAVRIDGAWKLSDFSSQDVKICTT
jgi:hypothetical protein